MSDKCRMCLLGLILLCALLTGIGGVDDTHVFISSGEDVSLLCNNALSHCTSTTWIYTRRSETAELITLGINKKDTERHERLSLGSDCSLNIKKLTKKDRGDYSCRQYENGVKLGTDAHVYLHVLHVSSSSSQSEIRSGSSLTLSCQLYHDSVSCDDLVGSEGIDLIWVNQAGVNLQTDSRFQISFSSGQCLISLTTTLLNEDHNREWRCQLQQRNQIKTSASYTVKYPAPRETKTASPVTSSKSTAAPSQPALATSTDTTFTPGPDTTPNSPNQVSSSVIVIAAASAVLLPAVILGLICRKRAGNRRGTNDSVEQKDDVTYIEVATHCKNQRTNEVDEDDKVTYSSIRGASAGRQEDCSQLYASVNKSHRK